MENPRDGGASWATVYGVTQSQTQLKRLSSSNSSSKRETVFPENVQPWGHALCGFEFQLILFMSSGMLQDEKLAKKKNIHASGISEPFGRSKQKLALEGTASNQAP